MAIDIMTKALSQNYTDKVSEGLGAIKGANCTIKSTTKTDGNSLVVFEWTGTSGTKETASITVKDGVSIVSISIDENNYLVCSMSDGTEKKAKIELLDNVYTKEEVDNLLKDKANSVHNHDDLYASKDKEHEHLNKETLDKFGVNDSGKLTFDGDVVTPEASDLSDYLKKTDAQNTYVVKETGKGLSENDLTAALKEAYDKAVEASHTHSNKSVLDSITNEKIAVWDKAEENVQSDWNETDDTADGFIKNKPTIPEAYDDTEVKTQIQTVANGLMDSVGYSADYKTIDIIAKNGVKKSVNVAPIISHASITELSDVDTTNKATGKALVYNATTSKHEYADVSGTDEKVKMDASGDSKYLGELLDNVTIANENGELKVKKLDGQEVTITEINYLKGLTMNVMDLVNMFSNGGVKIINTPVATYAELLTLDKSSFIEGISYLVYVLADENHDNAKTTYLVDKDSETPTYFGFADSQRDFTTNPIDLATEITGKLGIANMDSDAIKALFTVDDTYKTETATNNAFSTHGAKALYDELLLAIGNKANNSDLTNHKDDTGIHVSTEDRTKWDSAKTHADSAHAPSNAQANVLETVKVNGTALEVSDKAVNVTVPTTVAELTDSADYAKKTDIPTTLPANGGNADTVNNHTVETNVPADAVFTDTIYDDTEVKESIEELNSNLDTLEFGEIAGGKNLFNGKYIQSVLISEKDYTNRNLYNEFPSVSDITGLKYLIFGRYFKRGTYTFSYSNNNFLSLNRTAIAGSSCVISANVIRKSYTWTQDVDGYTYFTIEADESETSTTDILFKGTPDIQIEEGSVATEYEPYFPSNKMLAEENAQQSSNLDGLGYGENGAKNLFEDEIKWIENITVERGTKSVSDGKITLTATSDDCYTHHSAYTWKNNGIKTIPCKPNTTYTLSWEYEGDSIGDVYIFENGSTNNIGYTINKSHKLLITTSADAEYLTVRVGVRNSGTSITYWNFQLEEGDTATQYKPYIPSVKMLAEENAQQDTEAMDLKMLGWSVPSECPIQNYVDSNGVFHQRVGRVDLGSLEWSYETAWNATSGVSTIKNLTVNMYHSVYVPTIISVIDMPTNYVKKADSDTLWINNGSSTEKPSGYLYFELAEEKTISVDGNEAVTKVNESLSVIGKCKNLLNPTLETTTVSGVTCTNNGDGTYTLNGTASSQTTFVFAQLKSSNLFKNGITYKFCGCPKLNNNIWFVIEKNENPYTAYVTDYGNGGTFTYTSNDDTINIFVRMNEGIVLNNVVLKPMLTTNLNATYDDFVPYTGDGDTLTHDVAELKNDLSVKKFELVAGALWLCVSGKHCVLTLNGYNLTESTHFDKLEEYQPYLVARNVVSKGDSVCIAAVEPNGNINASDLVVGTQLTGQLFGEISWIANI